MTVGGHDPDIIAAMKRIGVDVGGTFTDFILVDEEAGRVTVDKVPSTPDDPSRGVVEGVRRLCAKAGVALSEWARKALLAAASS